MQGYWACLMPSKKFEPERGVKFKTYAEVRIRGTILDSLRDLDWAPRSLRKKSKGPGKSVCGTWAEAWPPGDRREVSEALGREH